MHVVLVGQVAAEVAAYKATRRTAAFEKLAGQLDADTAAAADKVEQQTAQLQQLEAAVAEKAAVLQSLTEKAEKLSSQVCHPVNCLRCVPRAG